MTQPSRSGDLATHVEPPVHFVGIGALKAGTTYLDRMLRAHPELALPDIKETNYFAGNYRLGPDWYAARFAKSGRTASVRGEVCPTYLTQPACISRILRANAQVRIVVSLREPRRRLVSQYHHWAQETGAEISFEDFLQQHPGAWRSSLYADRLQPWFDAIDRSRMHVLVFEELVQSPTETLPEVYDFLGVDPTFRPAAMTDRVNVSARRRFSPAYVAVKKAVRALGSTRARALVEAGKRLRLDRVFETTQPMTAVLGRTDLPGWLDEAIGADVARLADELGRDLGQVWRR